MNGDMYAWGRQEAARLAAEGVAAVALSWVDNAGVTRVKTVPTARLAHAVRRGVGMSPVFDVFTSEDAIAPSPHLGGPDGDLRLFPDLDRLTVLAAQPGWAWAPVDRYDQHGGRTRRASGCSPAAWPSGRPRAAWNCGWASRPSGSWNPPATAPPTA